ncbi:MAG: HD domain-containing phosphohydrolase [Oligoflexales bacterium]
MSYLILKRGPEHAERITIRSFPALIGRDQQSDIVVQDNSISRFHVRIRKRGRIHIIEDLDSSNGTFVNGERVHNATLHTGDHILIGDTVFMFAAIEENLSIQGSLTDHNIVIDDKVVLDSFLEPQNTNGYKIKRLPQSRIFNHTFESLQEVQKIFDAHGHILLSHNVDHACQSLLKSCQTLAPQISRGTLFAWSSTERSLTPLGTRNYDNKKNKLKVSPTALDSIIKRKRGLFIESPDGPQFRLLLPMVHHGRVLCALHIEGDHIDIWNDHYIDSLQSLLEHSAPIFQNMLLTREIDDWLLGMVETIISVIDAKDTYTAGHSERVSKYSLAIADQLQLSQEVKRLLMISSICHDLGKVGIPDHILKKASLLTHDEYEEMKLHPTIGAELLNSIPDAQRFISGVKYHHEKWDGTGYPDGLDGEKIPFFGRIIAVADSFDAMVSGRSYAGFMTEDEAIQRIIKEGHLYDKDILNALEKSWDSGILSRRSDTATKNPSEATQTTLGKKDQTS